MLNRQAVAHLVTVLNGSSLISQVGYLLKLLPTLYFSGHHLLVYPAIRVMKLADQLQVILPPW